ncbi:endo alpha-1,4 polygalactosaminidase [Paenibacillus cremeus]|nr:endo alpha-1,4 polygalactosaminidase [Paenibacillus cremeus]
MRLASVKSFMIYYGHPTAETMSRLKQTDLAIIEPQQYTKEQIDELRSAGTFVIAYISVMESPTWNLWRTNRLKPDHYWMENGQRLHFTAWDSYLMDLRKEEYRELLLHEIERMAVAKGSQGLLLDTVGDIDDYIEQPFLREDLRAAYRRFLMEVSSRFGTLTLIQNRGFESLNVAAPYLHGFLWEDWRAGWQTNDWMLQRVRRLLSAKRSGLQVFTVSTAAESDSGKEAEALQFIHHYAPDGYLTL